MGRLELLKKVGKEFSDKIKEFPEIIEVGITGSTAGKSNYPGDLDIFVILDNFNHIEDISKIARKIYGIKHISMDIFFLNRNFEDLGRLCHRKDCPVNSVECSVRGCGEIKHIKKIENFVFDKKQLLSSPVEVLFSKENLFFKEREKEAIKNIKRYEKLEDIKINCIECGKGFTFTIGEQKFYKERGLNLPRRCEGCREKRWLNG